MDEPVEAWLARHERKELVRFVTVGSVDDGKSTLIGRLLYDTQGVYEDQLAAVRRASRDAEEDLGVDLALITDGLKAEREQGITIDVAYRYFSTETRKYILADTPGHVQYTRNMATGASTAEVALILLDARLGVLPQSRRHAYVVHLLGIRHLAVCVNKMDLVDWSEDTYTALQTAFQGFVGRLGFESVTFFPVSARKGDNVARRSGRMPWHRGPTVLEYLEAVPVHRDREAEALRFPVQYVLRPHLDYRAFAGTLASGLVRVGDEVLALPSGRRTRVAGIDTYEGAVPEAFAPMAVALRLEDALDVSRGDMLVHPDRAPSIATRLEAHLVWMSERPLSLTRSYLLKHTTRVVLARVETLHAVVDPDTLEDTPAETLGLNDIGRVTVRAQRPLFCDPYRALRGTGSFILVDPLTNDTVAAGMLSGAAEGGQGEALQARSRVSLEARRRRLGQRGGVLWLRAGAQQSAFACAVEAWVYDLGGAAVLVDGVLEVAREVALRCADAGLLAICAVTAQSDEAVRSLALEAGEERFLEAAAPEDPSRIDAEARALAEDLVARAMTSGAPR
ncbi:MAG: sulfate adenylyltransferase [Deltaproteobacteria bacterium]|nr:sulfate adenylyltransferase [Deltaproteobacteria bacterium]